jgi:very-short-patch-repair endonuclease
VPERILWWMLRDRRLGGLKFRRQVPVGPYVVDFLCDTAGLVLELDGMSHVGTGAKDDRRTAYIESRGLHVLRVTNDDLLHHDLAVAEAILQAAAAGASVCGGKADQFREAQRTRPSPRPSPKGRGGSERPEP